MYEKSRKSKSMETESRLMVAWVGARRGQGVTRLLWGDKNILKLYYDDGGTNLMNILKTTELYMIMPGLYGM